MRLLNRSAFSLFVFIFFTQLVTAKPASLVLKESFGSDPYKKIAHLDGYLLVTGKNGAGRPENSNLVDLLSYSNSGFSLLKQYQFDELQSGFISSQIYDVMTVNGHFIILSDGPGLHGRSATVLNGELTIVDEAKLSLSIGNPIFSKGENNRFYAFGYDYNNSDKGIKVITVNVGDNGEFEVLDDSLLGASIETSPSYTWTRFTATYHDDALYLVSNEKDGNALFFKVTLDEQGVPLATESLDFPAAEAEYRTLSVRGNYLYASYVYWGFQVLKLEEDTLTEVFNYAENSTFVDFKFLDDYLFATDTFSTIEVFKLDDPEDIVHHDLVNTRGFQSDSLIVDNELIVTQGWNGIQSYSINPDFSITSNHHFSQSGDVSDLSFSSNQLAVASLRNNLHFWTFAEDKTELMSNIFMINGVYSTTFFDEKLLVNRNGSVYEHRLTSIQNNEYDGTYLGNTGTSGSANNKMDLINDGFYTISGNTLSFFNKNSLLTSSLKVDQTCCNSRSEQYPISDGNSLYLPSNNPGRVTIFDASDIENVTQVSQIERSREWMYGNLAKVGNYLLVPDLKVINLDESQSNSNVISVYDVSVNSTPVFIKDVVLPGSITQTMTLHIYDNYLIVLTDINQHLYQFDNISEPTLIETTLNQPATEIAQMFGNELFSVRNNTSGHIQRSYINYAPSLRAINANFPEDEEFTLTYVAQDRENDATTLSVQSTSENISIEIIEEQKLKIIPMVNQYGSATAVLRASDVHGNFTEVTAEIIIESVNDLPSIVTTSVNTAEDTQLNVQIEATDVESENLIFSLSKTQTDSGQAVITQDGLLTYTSNNNFFGEDSVEVLVEDEDAGLTSRIIRINVLPVNDVPFLVSSAYVSGDEDSTIILMLEANDIEQDDISFALLDTPDNWNVTLDGDSLKILPVKDINGDFTITLSISDGMDTLDQEINVQVIPVNDPPVVSNEIITKTTFENTALSGVIEVTDIDGDALTYILSVESSNGVVSLSSSGNYVYTPNTGSLGTDSFEVTISDPLGESVVVTVNISVTVKTKVAKDSSGGAFSIYLVLALLIGLIGRGFRPYKII